MIRPEQRTPAAERFFSSENAADGSVRGNLIGSKVNKDGVLLARQKEVFLLLADLNGSFTMTGLLWFRRPRQITVGRKIPVQTETARC